MQTLRSAWMAWWPSCASCRRALSHPACPSLLPRRSSRHLHFKLLVCSLAYDATLSQCVRRKGSSASFGTRQCALLQHIPSIPNPSIPWTSHTLKLSGQLQARGGLRASPRRARTPPAAETPPASTAADSAAGKVRDVSSGGSASTLDEDSEAGFATPEAAPRGVEEEVMPSEAGYIQSGEPAAGGSEAGSASGAADNSLPAEVEAAAVRPDTSVVAPGEAPEGEREGSEVMGPGGGRKFVVEEPVGEAAAAAGVDAAGAVEEGVATAAGRLDGPAEPSCRSESASAPGSPYASAPVSPSHGAAREATAEVPAASSIPQLDLPQVRAATGPSGLGPRSSQEKALGVRDQAHASSRARGARLGSRRSGEDTGRVREEDRAREEAGGRAVSRMLEPELAETQGLQMSRARKGSPSPRSSLDSPRSEGSAESVYSLSSSPRRLDRLLRSRLGPGGERRGGRADRAPRSAPGSAPASAPGSPRGDKALLLVLQPRRADAQDGAREDRGGAEGLVAGSKVRAAAEVGSMMVPSGCERRFIKRMEPRPAGEQGGGAAAADHAAAAHPMLPSALAWCLAQECSCMLVRMLELLLMRETVFAPWQACQMGRAQRRRP